MIGWCCVTPGWEDGRQRISRAQVVHASTNCDRLKGGTPWQVWIEGARMWLPPVDRDTPSMQFRWCAGCRAQPSLPQWRKRGACVGADSTLFFPDEQQPYAKVVLAKRICAQCQVREECLEWALAGEEFGVWGGLSAGERERLKSGERVRMITEKGA